VLIDTIVYKTMPQRRRVASSWMTMIWIATGEILNDALCTGYVDVTVARGSCRIEDTQVDDRALG
jgi:hypothetical protein